MSLQKKITENFNIALKNKNKPLVSTLRLILAAIKEKEIASRSFENKGIIKDKEIIQVLRKMKKQRKESADMYQKADRKELLESENAEIKVIDSFLPQQLSEEETKKICKEVIDSLGTTSMKDIGKIMGALKKTHSDVIDFSKVNLILKEMLK